jgi:hypothetical protein
VRHHLPVTDDELFARQAALQARADDVLRDLDVLALLRAVGTPTRTGSSVLGLMVARDIDITTVGPTLDVATIFPLGLSLAEHPRVWRVTFRNETGHWNTSADYVDGLYWLVECDDSAGDRWKLDLWFLLDGTTQYDLEHIQTLPGRLTPEARAAILRIKEDRVARDVTPSIPSYTIYEAVLDHDVRTPAEFARHLAQGSPTPP